MIAEAHNGLGVALADEHRSDAALQEYREALDLDPKLATAHNNLANGLKEGDADQLATMRRIDEQLQDRQHCPPD